MNEIEIQLTMIIVLLCVILIILGNIKTQLEIMNQGDKQ